MRCGFLLVVFFSLNVHSQISDIFSSNARQTAGWTIITHIHLLLNSRYPNAPLIDAELICNESNLQFPIQIRTRGNFRNRPDYCRFSPLMIEFDPDFKSVNMFDRLKIITPCQSDELLEREMVIYKIYNALTDFSFRISRVELTFIDYVDDTLRLRMPALCIEPIVLLSERTGSVPVDPEMLRFTDIDTTSLKIFTAFQFLIGNNDWDIYSGKNTDFVFTRGHFIPIPYDFDFAAIMYDKKAKNLFLIDKTPDKNRSLRKIEGKQPDVTTVNDLLQINRKNIRKIILKSNIALSNKIFMLKFFKNGRKQLKRVQGL